jgi:hypothetical protein
MPGQADRLKDFGQVKQLPPDTTSTQGHRTSRTEAAHAATAGRNAKQGVRSDNPLIHAILDWQRCHRGTPFAYRVQRGGF